MHIMDTIFSGMRSFSRRTAEKRTLLFLVPGILCIAGGVAAGDAWALLAYVGTACVFAGYVLHWRRPKWFLLLAGASILCFPVGVLLHNGFYALNELYGHIVALQWLFGFLHVVFFLLAVLFSPVGLVVGVAGWTALSISRRRSSAPTGKEERDDYR